jgi:hypothetical protein
MKKICHLALLLGIITLQGADKPKKSNFLGAEELEADSKKEIPTTLMSFLMLLPKPLVKQVVPYLNPSPLYVPDPKFNRRRTLLMVALNINGFFIDEEIKKDRWYKERIEGQITKAQLYGILEAPDEAGNTALYYAAKYCPRAVRALLAAGAQPHKAKYSPVHALVYNYQVDEYSLAGLQALLQAGTPIDTQTSSGATPLALAANCLYAAGNELSHYDYCSKEGCSIPNIFAIRVSLVKALLDAGARTDIQNKDGEFPLQKPKRTDLFSIYTPMGVMSYARKENRTDIITTFEQLGMDTQ